MSLDLDDHQDKERTMDFVRQARFGTTPAGYSVAPEPPRPRGAGDVRHRIDSRIVLSGCAVVLSLVGVWSTIKALQLRPPPTCHSSPVRAALGAETTATIETGSGAACTVMMVI